MPEPPSLRSVLLELASFRPELTKLPTADCRALLPELRALLWGRAGLAMAMAMPLALDMGRSGA